MSIQDLKDFFASIKRDMEVAAWRGRGSAFPMMDEYEPAADREDGLFNPEETSGLERVGPKTDAGG